MDVNEGSSQQHPIRSTARRRFYTAMVRVDGDDNSDGFLAMMMMMMPTVNGDWN